MSKTEDLKNQISSLEKQKENLESLNLTDEVKELQTTIESLQKSLKEMEEEDAKKQEEEKKEEEKQEEETKEEDKKEEEEKEKPLSPEEYAQKVEQERQKIQKYNELAEKRNIKMELIKAALEMKPDDFDGDDEKYLDEVGLKANKSFDSGIESTQKPEDEIVKGLDEKEIQKEDFMEKHKDTIEKLDEVAPEVAQNMRADNLERPGGYAEQLEQFNGWRTPKATGGEQNTPQTQ